MVDRTQEDILQDRRLAALETKVGHLDEAIGALEFGLRQVHVRIDRTPGTVPPVPPALPPNLWTFLLRLFGK